jgi:6-pyruvoyltetrahydropterin/6-carboxytetrahydropterin synthase
MNTAAPLAPVTIVKRLEFSAAHHFWVPHWSAEQNRQAFGPTANRYSHGHNYTLLVGVSGPVDPTTGMVMNLTQLKQLLHAHVLNDLHFKHLNWQVPFFKHNQPTLEALAVFIWHRTQQALASHPTVSHLNLAFVDLKESDDLGVWYNGTPVAGVNLEDVMTPSMEDTQEAFPLIINPQAQG